MLSLRNFWRRHRRKVFATVGVVGSGYVLYKLYAAHRQRLLNLEREIEGERETDELIKAQLQAHFENIQRIADSTTLPYAMHYLRSRISDELDLSHLTERLMQGKGQPNTLTSMEKLELWERLKILSFTRMVLSLWAMTMLSLYIRVQVNILGRHLYVDTARGIGHSHLLEEADKFDRHGQQEFLATADYLSNYGLVTLIPNMHKAATEVLKGKQLRDPFNTSVLRETIMQILDMFMSMGAPNHWVTYHADLIPQQDGGSQPLKPDFDKCFVQECSGHGNPLVINKILDMFMSMGAPNHWVTYLVPENAISYRHLTVTSSNNFDDTTLLPDINKLDQLMVEARAVLLSADFGNVVEISLRSLVDALMEDIGVQSGRSSPSSGIPLAKLLPRVTQMGPVLLEEPSRNRFIQIIRSLPEVELFYTLLYANMPLVQALAD